MADLVVVSGVLAFFGICVLFVRACDALIGPDPADTVAEPKPIRETGVEPTEVAS